MDQPYPSADRSYLGLRRFITAVSGNALLASVPGAGRAFTDMLALLHTAEEMERRVAALEERMPRKRPAPRLARARSG